MGQKHIYKNFPLAIMLIFLLQIVTVLQVLGQCDPANDRQILLDLIDADWQPRTGDLSQFIGTDNANGSAWNVNDINNYADWQGVETWEEHDPNSEFGGCIYQLYLHEASSAGTVPNSIGNFNRIAFLWLSNNNLTGGVPTNVFNNLNLNGLYLFGNNFNGGPFPNQISQLTQLVVTGIDNFNESGNRFTGDFPNIPGLVNLERFFLRGHEFENLPDFPSKGKITQMGVANNRFTFEDLMEFVDANQYPNLKETFFFSPQKDFTVPQNTYNVNENDNVTIDLGIDGSLDGSTTPNTYNWYQSTDGGITFSGDPVATTDVNSLNFPNIATDDEGVYYCEVSNVTFDRNSERFLEFDDRNTTPENIPLKIRSENITVTVNAINQERCPEDREVLVELYDALGGDGWGNSRNWNSDLPISDWNWVVIENGQNVTKGVVEVNNEGCVVDLNLDNNNLIGEIPDDIGNLSEIVSLRLSRNQISGDIPTVIGANLGNLVNLYLDQNLLTGNIPTNLGNLANLRFLHVNQNGLTGGIPAELGKLNLLENFSLWDNGLTGEIPTELEGLTNCRYFALGINNLSGGAPDFLGDLSNLEELYLSENPLLTGPLPNSLTQLNLLHTFHFFSTDLCVPNNDTFQQWLVTVENRSQNNNHTVDGTGIICNNPPTDITLDNTTINSDALGGSLVGILTTIDDDLPNDSHVYTITDNCNPDAVNNALFAINGDQLLLANDFILPVGATTLTVCITTTDEEDASFSKSFTITINVVEDNCVTRDRTALTEIYNALGGAVWDNSDNWLTVGVPLNTWYGVTTNDQGCVTELNLAGNILTGEIPAEIGDLLELEFLDLGGNSITGTIPNDVTQLTYLRTFGVASNTLTGTLPPNFNNLTVLERLWIDNNNLSGNFPAVLLSMPSLTEIYMQVNEYNGTLPNGFNSLTNLVDLNLGNNNFSGTLPATIGNLGNLNRLGLYNNNFTGQVPDSYANLNNLDFFEIQGNELEGLIPVGIAGNNDFTNIQIEVNKFTFQDVLPFIDTNFESFTYSPQDSIGTGGDFTLNVGETLPVDLGIDPNITNNVYQWYKDGDVFGTPSNVGTIELSEPGIYTCQVTNPRARALELWSRVITIRTGNNPPTDILLTNTTIEAVDAVANFEIGTFSTVDDDNPNDTHVYTFTDDCGVAVSNTLFAIDGDRLLLGPSFVYDAAVTSYTICVTSTDLAQESINKSFEITIRPTVNDCIANDRAVLEALYDALGGDGWDENTNWKSTQPLNLWFGVETNENGCVTRVLLEDNNLVGTIPAEVGNFAEIVEINIGKNNISGTIPADFGKLTTLELLWLNENNLGGQIPAGFFGMSNLTNLYLFQNNLQPPMPNQLNQLTKLLVFGFDNNETPFADNDFPAIGNLTVLQKFYIQNHDFEDVPTITNPALLTEMGLASNRFTFEDLLPFSNLNLEVFLYAPQDSVGTQNAVTLQKDQTFTIDLGIDINITNSVYRWYKDGALVEESNSNTFTINQVSTDDEGEYTCEVTNPDAPDLTLYARKTTLTVIDNELPPPVLTAALDPANPAERIILTWTYPSSFTPEDYTIERSVGDSLNFVEIISDWTENTYTDGNGLMPGETYYYRVLAVVDGERSPYSNVAFVTTNSLPIVSDIDKTGAVNTVIPFTLADFTGAFTDVDNDPLATVQILSLPLNGQLTLQGNPVNTNDEIPADQLNNLVFTPATDYVGTTSFDYNASDGYNYALNPAAVNITIEEVEDVDLVVNDPQTNVSQVEAGNEISVSANVAINGGPTSDEAVFVLLLSTDTLPDGGDIQLASAIVPAQTTGASQQINNTITIPEDLEPGEYFLVYYIDAQQAVTETDEINNLKFVRIIILPEGPQVTIMNLITANGDGSNDMLYVRNIESYPDNEVILLDRWGNVVNTFPNYNNDWSPIVGQDIPDFGSYLCIVKLNEVQVTVKRMVSIIRDTNQ